MTKRPERASTTTPGTVSVPRALSKLGVCSRAQGERLVEEGRVSVNGVRVRSIGSRVTPETDVIEVDSVPVLKARLVHIALNKPRGLVTTRDDPQGRPTIYECLTDASLPFVGPVGRLDKASEGLLLLTNDTGWADAILSPETHVEKTYHVQVRGNDLETLVTRVGAGVLEAASGERLDVERIALLRSGSRNTAWFDITLTEGKNRQLRRIFSELGVEVTRLVRVAIGSVGLGTLAKGEWRHLTNAEVKSLTPRRAPNRPGRSR